VHIIDHPTGWCIHVFGRKEKVDAGGNKESLFFYGKNCINVFFYETFKCTLVQGLDFSLIANLRININS